MGSFLLTYNLFEECDGEMLELVATWKAYHEK